MCGIALLVFMVLAAGTSPALATDAVCPGLLNTVTVNDPAEFQVIAAAGDLVITGDTHGLTTWDLRDASDPKRLGSFVFRRGGSTLYFGNPMDAYLHSSGTWGCILPQFSCFDVRSPTSPQPMRWQVDEWPDHRLNTGWNERNGTAFNDRFIAARNNLSNGPDEIWFLEPMSASPRWIKPIAWQDRFSSIIDLAFVDDYLVVLEFDGTVSIFDIGDGLLPVTIGSNYVEQGTDLVGGHEIALAVSWQVGPGPGYSVIAIDLQNPASPTQHDLTQDLQWDQVHQLHLIGRTAIVLVDTGGKTRLMEIDLSVPSSPRIIGSRPHLGRIMAATDRFIAVTSTGSSQLTFHKRNPRRQSRNQNIAVGASDGVE